MTDNAKYRTVLRGAAAVGLAGALLFPLAGCHSNSTPAPIVSGSGPSGDPADANLAPYTGGNTGGYTNGSTQVMGASQAYEPQQSAESYNGYYNQQQNPAPIIQQYPSGAPPADYQGYTDAEEAGEAAIADTDQAPPPLPEYDQPPAPDPNYIWTPGYWCWGAAGYYWVPGAWVAPPYYGALWTPPWWGWYGNHWWFHRGYWGPHIGYYGGINYGFGYIGFGYFGGYWRGHDFIYNRAVTNINPGVIHNFYQRPVVYNGVHYGPHPTDRVSYNGGRGGIDVRPRPAELAAQHEAHYAPVAAQRDARMAAAANRGQHFAANHGRPATAFANHPIGSGRDIAAAPHEEPFNHPGAARPELRPGAIAGAAAAHGFAANHAATPGAHPNFEPNHGAPAAHPNFNRSEPTARPEANHPNFEPNHAAPAAHPNFNRPEPAARPEAARPNFEPNRAAPAAHPNINRPEPTARPEAAHPNFNRPQPAARPEAARPAPMARPAPAFHPRPAPAPRPAAHPAPAPHEGGNEHHH